MKAVFITGHGGNAFVSGQDCAPPLRHPGEVLVRMHAATLNQVDLYMRTRHR
jgi:NADPH:quinone reductase-like Zn-dependent oxidoreductase